MTLLRTGNFRQEDAVAESFMRSSVVRENDHPFRFAQDVFGSGFFTGAVLSMASVGIENEDGTVFAADLDRLAARKLLSRPPHRKRSERGRASGSEGLAILAKC